MISKFAKPSRKAFSSDGSAPSSRRAALSFTVEKMRLDETGYPQPTGEFETIAGDSLILALGQDTDLSFLERVPGIEICDGVVKVVRK